MSSIGQALGGLVGGVIGFMVGGPSGALRGAQLGIMAGGLLDPPKVKGPRLDDLSFQTSTYGSIIPRVYGTVALHGNVFWLKGNSLTETSSTSGGKGGPEVTSYSYSATFAVGLCQGPIEGIRRIWVGSQLWYDAGANDIESIIASNQQADRFNLYLGSSTQTADPLIQADKGVANVPAYRGLAYIVFDALPLEKYGNSLMGAQVKVEVVASASAMSPRVLAATDVTGYPLTYYPRPVYSVHDGIVSFYAYDPFAGTATVEGETVGANEVMVMVDFDGNYVGTTTVPSDVLRPQYSSSGLLTTRIGKFGGADVWWPEYSGSYAIQNGTRDVLPWGIAGARDTANVTADQGDIADYLTGEAGRYIIGIAISADGQRMLITTGSTSRGVSSSANKYFVLDTDLAITASGTIAVTTAGIWNICGNTIEAPNGGTVLDNNDNSGWTSFVTGGAGVASARYFYVDSGGIMQVTDEINNSLTGIGYLATAYADGLFYVLARTSTVARLYTYTAYPTVTASTVTLGTIVEAECLRSGLIESADIDVTDLTDTVRGYRVSQLGAIRAAIEPLRAVWPFDVVMHGYDIQFKRRGSASVATIAAADLDARPAGQASGVEITDGREMDLVLPRKVSIRYLDSVREYDVNEQSDERINTDAVNHELIDVPVVLNADEAKQTASRLLYLMWLERYDVVFSLPPEYLQLEPGDVVTVNADNATYTLRLVSVHYTADARLECKAKYESASIYTQSSQGEDGQSTGGNLSLSGPTDYELLDIPLMRDDDDTAGFPVAMCGYLSGWPGGTIYRSEDDGASWIDLVASVTPGAVIGTASNALTAHGGTVFDFSSTLTVRPYSGTLASVTQAQLFAGQNWFAYGADGRWEIMAAMTVTDNGNGTYTLRDFLRGQRGTEWATGLHAVNDRFVLLDEAVMQFVSVNSSSIGVEKLYRGITFGDALDSDTDGAFTYNGVNLECLSPVHLTGDRDPPSQKWTLYWTRRSRYADWRDYVDAPLGEASESYEVEIYSSGTYATLKRTLTSTTSTVEYSSANQVTDFGSNQSTLYLKIYQLSATVGRGYPLTTSITRA